MTRLKIVLHSLSVIVLVAFVLRIGFIFVFHFYRLAHGSSNFAFGWEMGSVAHSIASGQGFASPCAVPSGPTALVSPLFPYLLAGIFHLFGMYSDLSGMAILTLNCLFSSLVCVVIVWIGRRTFGETVGIGAAWLWVFWPMAFWEAHRVWETSLSSLLFALTFLAFLELESFSTLFAVGTGLLWGLTALTNPAVIAFLTPAGIWRAWRELKENRKLPSTKLMLAAVVSIVSITPWLIRDYEVFHRFIPIRDNFGFELYIGNRPTAPGENRFAVHMCNNKYEAAKFREEGELAYIQEKNREAVEYIAQNPKTFLAAVLARVIDVWGGTRGVWLDTDLGGATRKNTMADLLASVKNAIFIVSSGLAFWGLFLAFREKIRGAVLYLILVLFCPLPYYLTHAENKYRHPLEPMLMLLASASLVYMWKRMSTWQLDRQQYRVKRSET